MKIYLSYPDLAYFLFTDAKQVTTIEYQTTKKRALYFLKDNEKIVEVEKQLKIYPNYIIVSPFKSNVVDISLDMREDYLHYMVDASGLKEEKSLPKKVEMLTEDKFLHFIKMSLFFRKWYKDIFISSEKTYSLFAAMVKSKKDFIKLYTNIIGSHSEQEVFSSMLTFLMRLLDYEQQKDNLSDYYREILRGARTQSLNVNGALKNLIYLPSDIPIQNKLLGFYLSIKE